MAAMSGNATLQAREGGGERKGGAGEKGFAKFAKTKVLIVKKLDSFVRHGDSTMYGTAQDQYCTVT